MLHRYRGPFLASTSARPSNHSTGVCEFCEFLWLATKNHKLHKCGSLTVPHAFSGLNFSRGLMPEAAGVVSLVCEPGNWETIAVTIVSVESEEESELMVVGPYVIKKDDRLVMNE